MENRTQEMKDKWNEMFTQYILPNPYITEWELGFCRDILNQNREWSDKQKNIWENIMEKRLKPYFKLLKSQQNGYCKPTTLRVVRYKG